MIAFYFPDFCFIPNSIPSIRVFLVTPTLPLGSHVRPHRRRRHSNNHRHRSTARVATPPAPQLPSPSSNATRAHHKLGACVPQVPFLLLLHIPEGRSPFSQRRRQFPHRLLRRHQLRLRDLHPQPPRQASRLGLPSAHVRFTGKFLCPELPPPPLPQTLLHHHQPHLLFQLPLSPPGFGFCPNFPSSTSSSQGPSKHFMLMDPYL